jgi:hypothetical protein
MSGFDKINLVHDLLAQGWTEAPEAGIYYLRPPESLVESFRNGAFYVHDAKNLQDLLSPAIEGTENVDQYVDQTTPNSPKKPPISDAR